MRRIQSARGAGVLHLTVRQSSAANPRRAGTGVWALLSVERVLPPGVFWPARGSAGLAPSAMLGRGCRVLFRKRVHAEFCIEKCAGWGGAGAVLSDPGGIPLWKRWQDVALARIAVAHEQIRQSVVFCGESALAIHGVPQWISNPDVEFTSGRAYTASWFPRVDVGDQCVPRVRVRRVTRKHPLRGVGNVRGLPAEDLWTTSVLIAAMRPPLEAFVAVSMALRRLSRFDRRDLAGSRVREEEARRILLELVAQGEDVGAYGMGRARRVVLAADAGCESVGEAALLYALTATSHEAPATQVPVRTRGGREFFLDAAVPGQR